MIQVVILTLEHLVEEVEAGMEAVPELNDALVVAEVVMLILILRKMVQRLHM